MGLPYKSKPLPNNWDGWNRLSDEEITEYLIKYYKNTLQEAIIEQACSSDDYVGICILMTGAHGYSFQDEIIQLQSGSFLHQSWSDLHKDAPLTAVREVHIDIDLREELRLLRCGNFKLRGGFNENLDLDTGMESRTGTIYIAIKSDIEWFSASLSSRKGRYRNNPINRLFRVFHQLDYPDEDIVLV